LIQAIQADRRKCQTQSSIELDGGTIQEQMTIGWCVKDPVKQNQACYYKGYNST
jgi:hypothetical protein